MEKRKIIETDCFMDKIRETAEIQKIKPYNRITE